MIQTTVVTSSPRLCCRAIIAGAIVALSIHLLLTMLGAGITALVVPPSTSDTPVQSYSTGLALSWSLSAMISLWLGGWVAGRVGAPGDVESGKLNGFVMWSAAVVVGFVLLAFGVGKALVAAGHVVAGAGKAVAEAAPEVVQKSAAMMDEYSAEVTPDGKPLTPAAKRELAQALKNLLLNGETGRTAQNRAAVIAIVARETKLTPEEAAKTVDEWSTAYDHTAKEIKDKAEAAIAKAKEIADQTAKVTGWSAIWTFFAFWIGAVMATWGGYCGAQGCCLASKCAK